MQTISNPEGVAVVSQGRKALETHPMNLIDPEGVAVFSGLGNMFARCFRDPFRVVEQIWRTRFRTRGLRPWLQTAAPAGQRQLQSRWFLLFISVALTGAGSRAATPEAVPVDGAPFAAELMGVDADWRIQFAAGSALRRLPAADLVTWGSFVDPADGTQVVLAGGGLLVADVVGLDKETLHCEGDLIPQIKLPLEAVTGILWHPPGDRDRRDKLMARVRAAAGDSDRLILDNGDELACAVTALTEKTVKVQTPAGPVDVEISRLAALIFNPSLAARPALSSQRAMLGFSDGSRLLATGLMLVGADAKAQVFGVGEVSLKSDKLVAIQPFGGRAVYLSDLKPSSYKFIPFLQLAWPFQQDANVAGGQLRCAGKLHLKGLGVHSASRLTYDLDRPYRFLQAELGIDDRTQGLGSVEFRVFVDTGDGTWQPRNAGPIQRGGERPAAISVDLTDAKRISLLVEFADRGDELDDADWLNARLVK